MNFKKAVIGSSISILLLYGIILGSAFYFLELNSIYDLLSSDKIISAIWISLSGALLATFFTTLISIPAAYALSRYNFRFKKLVDVILELPMIISPAAIGALILIFFQTPLGELFRNNVIDVVYTFAGIVLAQFITVLGISTRMIKSVFDEIPVRYESIARTLGANPLKAFTKILLPMAKNGIVYSVILTFAKAIGEFGATITVAGSMSMKTETLPTAIFMALSTADIKTTVILILILFTISISVLIVTRFFFQRKLG